MNHVWFTPSGSEGVEACWKLARQYFARQGKRKWKAISRHLAYHGTTLGALSLMGVPELRTPFEPLVPGTRQIRNTARAGRPADETEEEFVAFLLDDLESAILAEDPDTVCMVLMEPVQNHGGSLAPPPGYLEGVRELCTRYDILLVSDETMTGFGRIGAWFAAERYRMDPDMITCAKGLSSSQAVIGAVIAKDHLFDAFHEDGVMFIHGSTFAAHPVSAAVTLKNLEIMQRLDLVEHVRSHEDALGDMVRSFTDLDVVADARGAGYMWSIELAKARPDGTPFTADDVKALYGPTMLGLALEQRGLLLRLTADAGDPILFVAPPLIAGPEEFEVIRAGLRDVLENISASFKTRWA